MTDAEFSALQKRVTDGKTWIERIKQEHRYWTPKTQPGIRLWFALVDQVLEESKRRVALLPPPVPSPAWARYLESQKKDEERRRKARERARAKAAAKRGELPRAKGATTQ